MSSDFVKKIKTDKCGARCKKPKIGAYSLCLKHLDYARETWRARAVERRAARLCTYCDRKSFKGFLRCRKHTLENRIKCKEWQKQHPEYQHEAWERRKTWITLGRCPTCPDHKALAHPYKRCMECQERRRLYVRGEIPPKRAYVARTWTWLSRNV